MSWTYFGNSRPDIQPLVNARGGRFLDVGCGDGALSAALKASGAEHVAGLEREPGPAAKAREHLDVVVEGDIATVALPFVPGEFDYLLFADVLEHLPDPEAVVERLLPFMAPDGRVVVSVPNMRFYTVLLRLIVDRWSYKDAGILDRTHLRIFTRRSLERMLGGLGLTIERLERNYRLVEDQSHIGRFGALATRVAARTIAPLLFRDLMAFQYICVARRAR